MSSPPPFDPYEVLGVPKDAPTIDIKKAHRKLVIGCHPDKIPDEAPESLRSELGNEFHRVQSAYEILSNPVERKLYDYQRILAERKAEQYARPKARGQRLPQSTVPSTIFEDKNGKKFQRNGQRFEERVGGSISVHRDGYKRQINYSRQRDTPNVKGWKHLDIYESAPYSHFKASVCLDQNSLPLRPSFEFSAIPSAPTQNRATLRSPVVSRLSIASTSASRSTSISNLGSSPSTTSTGTNITIPSLRFMTGEPANEDYNCGRRSVLLKPESSRSKSLDNFETKIPEVNRTPKTEQPKNFPSPMFLADVQAEKIKESSRDKFWKVKEWLLMNEGKGKEAPEETQDRPEKLSGASYQSRGIKGIRDSADKATKLAQKLKTRFDLKYWDLQWESVLPYQTWQASFRELEGHFNVIKDPCFERDANAHLDPEFMYDLAASIEKATASLKLALNSLARRRILSRDILRINSMIGQNSTRILDTLRPFIEHNPHPNEGIEKIAQLQEGHPSHKDSQKISRPPLDVSTLRLPILGHPAGVEECEHPLSDPETGRQNKGPRNSEDSLDAKNDHQPRNKSSQSSSKTASPQDSIQRSALRKELAGLKGEEARLSIWSALSGSPVDALDGHEWNALDYAASEGLLLTTAWLLQNGTDGQLQKSSRLDHLLQQAAENGHEGVMRLLLGYHASLEGHLTDGRHLGLLLEVAASNGRTGCVQLILEKLKAASFNFSDSSGREALRLSARLGHTSIVRLLLEYGTEPNAQSFLGRTALHEACGYGRAQVVQVLLEHGADIGIRTSDGHETALDLAKKHGYQHIVLLLERRIDASGSKGANATTPGDTFTSAFTLRRKRGSIRLGHGPQSTSDSSIDNAFSPPCPEDDPISKNLPTVPEKAEIEPEKAYQENQARSTKKPSIRLSTAADNSSCFTRNVDSKLVASISSIPEQSEVGMNNVSLTMDNCATDSTPSLESSMSEGSSSDDLSQDAFINVAFKKQKLLEILMKQFYTLIFPQWTAYSREQITHTDGSSPSQPPERSGQESSNINHTKRGAGKSTSKRPIDDRGPPLSEDEDQDGKRHKASLNPQDVNDCGRKFACPFFKYDPRTYSKFGACTGPGFATVSRVKEHLYRRHKPPVLCSRCWSEFENHEQLEAHVRAGAQCDLADKPPSLRMSQQRLELIRTKKRYTSDPGEEGRWRDIYRILFPGADIPCPYYKAPVFNTKDQSSQSQSSHDSQTFHEFARMHLPPLVEAKLTSMIQKRFHPVEEELKSSIGDTVRSSLSELFKSFQSMASSSSQPEENSLHSEKSGHTGQGNITDLAQMDEPTSENPTFSPAEPTFQPSASQLPFEEILDDVHRFPSACDSWDSGYAGIDLFPCVCDWPIDGSHFSYGEAPQQHDLSEESLFMETFGQMTSEPSQPCLGISGSMSDEVKGKGRVQSSFDSQPRLCGRCFGLVG